MIFQPQPYPLFFAQLFEGEVETARVIGWSVPDADDVWNLVPVVLFDEVDASVTEPRLADLSARTGWIADSRVEASKRAELALADARSESMTRDEESVIRQDDSEDLATVGSEAVTYHSEGANMPTLSPTRRRGTVINGLPRYVAPMGSTTTTQDIAVFLRERLNERAIYASDRKIHALLYLAQASHLATTGEPLFTEPITTTERGIQVAGVTDAPGHPLGDPEFGHASVIAATYGGLPATDLEALIRGQSPWLATAPGQQVSVDLIRQAVRALDDDPDSSIYGYTRAQRQVMRRPDSDPSPAGRGTPDSAEERAAFIAELQART